MSMRLSSPRRRPRSLPSQLFCQASVSYEVEQARIDSLRRPYTADIEFMSGMIGHHSQAVKMAGWCAHHMANKPLQIFSAGRRAGTSPKSV